MVFRGFSMPQCFVPHPVCVMAGRHLPTRPSLPVMLLPQPVRNHKYNNNQMKNEKKYNFDNIECEYLLNARIEQGSLPVYNHACMVASNLAGHHVPAHPMNCKACLASKNPKDDNPPVRGLINLRNHEIATHTKPITNKPTPKPPSLEKKLGSGPGTELSKLIPKALEHKGCGCKNFAKKMNRWGVDGCKQRFDQIVDHLVQKGNSSPLLGWVPSAASRLVAQKLVTKAIDNASGIVSTSLTWCSVVTTAPRKDCTLRQCIDSMEIAGFRPIIFAEPNSTPIANLTTIKNTERKGVWYNWLQSCEYALEKSSADIIMTVQDDSLFHPDSKTFAESLLWPAEDCGFLSLYTPKHYSVVPHYKTKLRDIGVNRVYTRSLWGACALIWPRAVLEAVVDHEVTKTWLGAPTKSRSKTVMERRKANPHLVQNSDTAIGKINEQNEKVDVVCRSGSGSAYI